MPKKNPYTINKIDKNTMKKHLKEKSFDDLPLVFYNTGVSIFNKELNAK